MRKILIPICLLMAFMALPLLGNTNSKAVKAANIGDDQLWMDEAPEIKPLQEGEFTLSLFGDTQKTIQNTPEVLEASFDWLIENKDNLKLKYVCHMGDVVDDVDNGDTGRDNIGDDPETQLSNASSYFEKLKNAGINFSLVLGNHDYEDMAFFNRYYNAFNQYFPLATTYTPSKNGEGYQGALDDTIENTYHYFNNGNDKYMILCIGHHPDDRIFEWADSILKNNTDRKVILITHGYISGGNIGDHYPYYQYDAGGYGERTPRGQQIFERLVYENDNVEMVFCGHSLGDDNKRIVRSDTYNKYGHIVHQFMTNPADIDLPCGGVGLIALMTFRNDGTVDTNYYSPYLHKYFNPDSQFSFDYASNFVAPSNDLTISNNYQNNNFVDDYSVYSEGSTSFSNKAYSYHNVKITNRGLEPITDDASITYKLSSNNEQVIRDALPEFNYSSLNRKGGVAVSVSTDGINYQAVNSFDGISQSARKTSSNSFKSRLRLRPYIYDSKDVYIRLSFLKESVNNIAILDFSCKFQKIKTVYSNGKFGINLNFADYENYDVTNWAEDAIFIEDILVMSGYLGTGRADDYAGARGTAIWRFDAPEGSTIESLIFDAKGRLTLNANDTFTPDFCFKLSYSIDDGEFVDYISESKGNKTSFKYDLSNVVKNAKTVHIKVQLWGDSWNSVGLSSLSITGGYRYSINYHCGDGINNENNPTTYGTSNEDIELYDPTCPQYYDFVGWYDNPNFEGEPMYYIPSGTYGSLDLYAKYEAIKRNIIYHLNGGKNSSNNPKTFEVVNGIQLEGATRNGYSFRGWFLDEDFEGNAIDTILPGTENDVELYAKFLKNYRISYVTNGGSINPDDKFDSFTEEDDYVLPIPTKDNYEFKGWYLEKTFENKIENIELGTDHALIVYAKWEKIASSKGCGGNIIANASIIAALSLIGISILLLKKKLTY